MGESIHDSRDGPCGTQGEYGEPSLAPESTRSGLIILRDYESPQAAQPSGPPSAAVLTQLKRLQCSPLLASCGRLMAFLQFVVDETLAGRGDTLKESVIGHVVYRRDAQYDPRIDSIVRVEARRLRGKLLAYYAGDGRLDPIVITIPTGGYKAVFRESVPVVPSQTTTERSDNSVVAERGPIASLAIMPLRAVCSDPRDENFADGLTDELVFALGRTRGLRIVSRAIMLQYKGRAWSPAILTRRLGVDAVLQGTVRHEGNIVRVTLEMCDPSGFAICSDRFDCSGENSMQLQERIATTVFSRMQLFCCPMRAKHASAQPIPLKAMAKIYRARQLLDQQTPAALCQALELFLRASTLAPACAQAHAGIADCHCDLFRLGYIEREAAARAAKPAARRAVELDASSAEAYAAIGTTAACLGDNPAAAEAAFQMALRLGNSARAARSYGGVLTILERHEEAVKVLRLARRLEPISCHQGLAEALSYFQARRYRELIHAAGEPGMYSVPAKGLKLRALAHIFAKDFAGARSLIGPMEDAASTDPAMSLALGEIEAWLGVPERGLQLMHAGRCKATFFAWATLAAALGDEDRCLQALEASVSRREFAAAWLPTDERFDRLRNSPRFTRLLEFRSDGVRQRDELHLAVTRGAPRLAAAALFEKVFAQLQAISIYRRRNSGT